ncbi:MAG: hypothetical protein A2506_13835 [Elusimicrobia bacterium RIFOXYD12_FULL_66_9]|nr:MAG: hypothetical protein A2506_13835 [Elusimicrobia bacterium RIFOXYD12_FULL_66_9]
MAAGAAVGVGAAGIIADGAGSDAERIAGGSSAGAIGADRVFSVGVGMPIWTAEMGSTRTCARAGAQAKRAATRADIRISSSVEKIPARVLGRKSFSAAAKT